ncbi:MAG: lipocalin family protein [Patescibacteria group bacterium]|nr:lipocalin family protein [Patescibacteria group bacterium]MDD5294853.1 lipocalin family protein [Patescibacteria group bacterium]MDD5554741.1 lipocalin family protein [Patescibacteria group bacterium]
MAKKIKPIKFPKDELAHNNIIEWWYFNGNLKDGGGNRYAFMSCLFKADAKKVKIPFLIRAPFKNIYFFHSILSDIKKKKFYSIVDYISVVSRDSFKKPLLFINHASPILMGGYLNRSLEETKKFSYRLKADSLDLKMVSAKKPLLESGRGYIEVCGRSSYYYSLTNLKTKGEIKIRNKTIKVTGKSWMDHQWANVSYSKDKWSWFSIQLDNDVEIMACEYDDGKSKDYLAGIMDSGGKQENPKGLKLTPGRKVWESGKTKAKYPLAWKIEIPERKINLKVSALVKNQEMIFGSINYWEGPIEASGSISGKKVKGSGFMELVGYPSKYDNADYVKSELEKIAKHFLSYPKRRLRKIFKRLK